MSSSEADRAVDTKGQSRRSMEESITTNGIEATPSEDALQTGTAENQSASELGVPSPDSGASLPGDQTKEADSSKDPEHPGYRRRRKLYQALARVEGSLKVKGDDIVLIAQSDKAELSVLQIGGQNTAMRLLKRPANRRIGIFSLYPMKDGVKIISFITDAEDTHPDAPPVNQMFISGKFAGQEEDAFFVDVGRNRRTIRAKKLIEMPLRIEGKAATPTWKVGQWIGLVLHRQGTKWVWQGDTRAVLKSGLKAKKSQS